LSQQWGYLIIVKVARILAWKLRQEKYLEISESVVLELAFYQELHHAL